MSLGAYGRRPGAGLGTWAALGGLGLLAGLGLALFVAWPRLRASPAAGAQFVSSRAPLRLNFSVPMDQASVEAALKTVPGRVGTLAWAGNSLSFTPAEPWPLSSTVTVTLAGARSQRGLPLLAGVTWTFAVAERRLVYLAGAAPNLWITTLEPGAAPRQLTHEVAGVYDYGLSPDGQRLAYSALRADGGADLRLLNVDGSARQDLLACPGQACVAPAFSPDGARLAYQRQALVSGPSGETSFGTSQVFVRPVDGAAPAETAIGDGPGRFPRWGPDGRLAYLDTGRQAIAVRDLASGGVTYIPLTSGVMGTWSPDGTTIVTPEIVIPPEPTPDPNNPSEPEASTPFYSYLLRVTIATNAAVNLSGEGVVDDASPVFSPSGGWLAFGRKLEVGGQWTPGRQVWLMRPDGSEAHALTADPLYNQSAFAWTADGGQLAYMRFNTSDPGEPAEVWLIDVDAAGRAAAGPAGPRRLAQGYLPEWLP